MLQEAIQCLPEAGSRQQSTSPKQESCPAHVHMADSHGYLVEIDLLSSLIDPPRLGKRNPEP
jgi:hypothetical protein